MNAPNPNDLPRWHGLEQDGQLLALLAHPLRLALAAEVGQPPTAWPSDAEALEALASLGWPPPVVVVELSADCLAWFSPAAEAAEAQRRIDAADAASLTPAQSRALLSGFEHLLLAGVSPHIGAWHG